MKKFLLILVTILAAINASAWDNYYYFGAKKLSITPNFNHLLLVSPTDSTYGFIEELGLKYVKTITQGGSDSAFDYGRVYECKKSYDDIFDLIVKLEKEHHVRILPGFIHCNTGAEIFPTGHISICIRDSSEIEKCRMVATNFNCSLAITEDNWISANLTYKGLDPREAIDIANRIDELKIFKWTEPEFYAENLYDDDYSEDYANDIRLKNRQYVDLDGYMLTYDPWSNLQWNLYNADNPKVDGNVSEAWNHATGNGVTVTVIDKYADYDHPDLKGKFDSSSVPSHKNNKAPAVPDGHGTRCCGILAAKSNNDTCIAGVAPNAKLRFISVDKEPRPFNYALQTGATVISLSLKPIENNTNTDDLRYALDNGRNGRGCIIVKSAGNNGLTDGKDKITFPGNEPGVITVSSYCIDGKIDPASSYGANIFVSAPGESIPTADLYDGTTIASGTSMAAPFVAGVVALMLEKNPYLHADSIRAIIGRTAIKIDSISHPYVRTAGKPYGTWNQYYGYGAIDAAACLKATPRPGRYGMIIPTKEEEEEI